MPIDLTHITNRHEPLIKAAANGNLVAFVGAGISRQARLKAGLKPFPTWTDLLKELIEVGIGAGGLNLEEKDQLYKLMEQGKYLMAAQAIRDSIDKYLFEDYIRSRFTSTGAEPGLIHYALFKLRSPLIMTTNYDCLLENAYAKEFGEEAETVTHNAAHRVQQVLKSRRPWFDPPLIFKIHGTAKEPAEIVLAEGDYRGLLYGGHGYRAVLSAVFVTKVVLMLGFSFSDPEMVTIIETLREGFKQRSSHDYIVLRKGIKGGVEKQRLRKDFGLEVIEYEPSQGDPELLELVEYLAGFVPTRSIEGG